MELLQIAHHFRQITKSKPVRRFQDSS